MIHSRITRLLFENRLPNKAISRIHPRSFAFPQQKACTKIRLGWCSLRNNVISRVNKSYQVRVLPGWVHARELHSLHNGNAGDMRAFTHINITVAYDALRLGTRIMISSRYAVWLKLVWIRVSLITASLEQKHVSVPLENLATSKNRMRTKVMVFVDREWRSIVSPSIRSDVLVWEFFSCMHINNVMYCSTIKWCNKTCWLLPMLKHKVVFNRVVFSRQQLDLKWYGYQRCGNM